MHRIITFLLFLIFASSLPAQSAVTLYATHTIGQINTEVTLDVRVNGFSDIIACQASVNWDPTLMKFVDVSSFGIQYLTATDFGTTYASSGHVRFLWEPDNALPVTAADSTVLFRIRFLLLSGAGQTTKVSFIDNQFSFPVEFANSNFDLVPTTTISGSAAIYQQPQDVVKIHPLANTSCDIKSHNGSLKADVNGDSVNFRFWWYNEAIPSGSPDFVGYYYSKLPAGIYSLEVHDKKGVLLVPGVSTEIKDDPNVANDTITIIRNNPRTSCTTSDGLIEIAVNKAQPANANLISWWKGTQETGTELISFRDTYTASSLDAGDYEVVVESKASGCVTYLKTAVNTVQPTINLSLSTTGNQYCKDTVNGTMTASVANEFSFNLRYYWFVENAAIDTAKANYKGKSVQNLSAGKYTSWVIDLNTNCTTTGNTEVANTPVYSSAVITQKADSLFASDNKAGWYLDGTSLNVIAPYIVPTDNGAYTISINNSFKCVSTSEPYTFRITGLQPMETEILVFPNPFTETVRVSNPEGVISSLQIYNENGALVFETFNLKDRFTDIRLTGSDNGVYFLKILKNNSIETKKLVKSVSLK